MDTERPYKIPEIVAHRGANDLAPENSTAAAALCVNRGVDWLEIDVRTTRDGVMYNLHDRTLERTSGGATKASLARLTSAEADRVDIGGWFAKQFTGERLPRVESLIEQFRDRIRFFFDVKSAKLKDLVDLTERYELQERSFFWFWSDRRALRFHRLAPHLMLKINASNIADVHAARRRFGARIVECGVRDLSEALVDTCHALGMRLMVMSDSDDPEIFRTIISSGADMVNLDHVDAFLQTARGPR